MRFRTFAARSNTDRFQPIISLHCCGAVQLFAGYSRSTEG